MGLGPELDLLAEHGGVLLLLLLPHGGLAAEEIDLGAGRQQTLMLLPLEGLPEECEETGWRDDGDLARERLGDGGAPALLGAAVGVGLAGVEVGAGEEVLCKKELTFFFIAYRSYHYAIHHVSSR